MNGQKHKNNILPVAFLITGNSVGSGLLALPVCIGLAGLVPGIIAIVISCSFMTLTGLVLADVVNTQKRLEFDLPSLYEEFLGKSIKWLAILANLIVLYGLLVAYLSCLTVIAEASFGFVSLITPAVIFLIISIVNIFAVNIIKRSNTLLVVILITSFVILMVFTGENIRFDNYHHTSWSLVLISLPILVNSFNFHNMVPLVCRILEFNKKRSIMAIILGVGFSFILNLLWCIAVIGVLNYSLGKNTSILYSFKHNFPATVPLSKVIHLTSFNVIALIFTVVAVVTSYWTVGAALTGFIGDLKNVLFRKKGKNYMNVVYAFIPPLIITYLCPSIFISIQGIIGGIGITIIFGILPAFILLRKKGVVNKSFALILICFFSFVLTFVLLHKFGILRLL